MKLYYSPGACSLSPHIVLHESGLAFEAIPAPTKTHKLPDGTDYYTINPLGYVPLLELDGGPRPGRRSRGRCRRPWSSPACRGRWPAAGWSRAACRRRSACRRASSGAGRTRTGLGHIAAVREQVGHHVLQRARRGSRSSGCSRPARPCRRRGCGRPGASPPPCASRP
jgi:hypothetical protein